MASKKSSKTLTTMETKPKVVGYNNYKQLLENKEIPPNRETTDKPSQTVPNMSMTLQEIVNKFTQPMNWPQPVAEQYDTPQSAGLPDISKMDRIEIAELNQSVTEEIKKQQSALRQIQEEQFQKQQQEIELLKKAKKEQEMELLKQAQNNP